MIIIVSFSKYYIFVYKFFVNSLTYVSLDSFLRVTAISTDKQYVHRRFVTGNIRFTRNGFKYSMPCNYFEVLNDLFHEFIIN